MKIPSEKEGDDQLWWNSNASSVVHLFQNKVMLLLKIMLIYDAPLLNGQPPLSGHLPVPQGWSALNGCCSSCQILLK